MSDSMPFILTVLGPTDPTLVGVTASHEHLFARSTSNRLDADTQLSEMDTAVEELLAYKEAGGDALVEVTTIDMGHEAERLRELSAATGVKIIAATGFYKGSYTPSGVPTTKDPQRTWDYLPEVLRRASVSQIAEVFTREIREGISGTQVRAGIIGEVGTSFNRVLEVEARVLRAAAGAQLATGAPISTHTTLGSMGREQVQILKEAGADLGHVVLSHMDLCADTTYHVELARQGVMLGFDTAGKLQYQSDATRVELIKRLVREGFEDQVVISCDIGRRSQMQRYGGRGYVYLLRAFVPALQAAGIAQGVIDKFLIHNPRRLLTMKKET